MLSVICVRAGPGLAFVKLQQLGAGPLGQPTSLVITERQVAGSPAGTVFLSSKSQIHELPGNPDIGGALQLQRLAGASFEEGDMDGALDEARFSGISALALHPTRPVGAMTCQGDLGCGGGRRDRVGVQAVRPCFCAAGAAA